MSKTKDAFALRNFDKEKILSQLFNGYAGYTNEEIIKLLRQRFEVEQPEVAIRCLSNLLPETHAYQTRLTKHVDKLLRYATLLIEKYDVDETVQTKVRRAKNLSNRYAQIACAVRKLQEAIYNNITEIEGDSETFLRRRFATRLRKARAEAGLTQQQLADKIQMSQGGYTQYELARRDPSIPTLIKLSRILNQSSDWLLGLTP